MKHVKKAVVLFLVGGSVYFLTELLWRGHSHWSMFLAGGICFLIIGGLNEGFTWDMSLLYQGVVGSAVVTAVELVFGLIFNVWLGLGVWDYSNLPFNFMGQICLPFSLLWILVSMAAVVLDDWLRRWWFAEDKPYYKIL